MTTYQNSTEGSTNWQPIRKAAEIIEDRLIEAVLDGTFPINSHLPGERELAESLGVTRPTLREALQRLARDGWLEIHHGKPTRVRDYWKEGRLGVLNTLSEHPDKLPGNFIPNLLNVRLAMAPMYTALAVSNASGDVVSLLEGRSNLNHAPGEFAKFDWTLQHTLTLLSENPVFIMILNGFEDMYLNLAPFYFSIPAAREHSLIYYENLAGAARKNDVFGAKSITEEVMRDSLNFWQQTKFI